MTEEVQKNPFEAYTQVATELLGSIINRSGVDGDPQAHAEILSRLIAPYMVYVSQTRAFGPADAFVVQVLDAVAYLASGGVQAQRFRDMATAAIAGSVHVEAAYAAVQAQRARDAAKAAPAMPSVQDGPLAPLPADLEPPADGPAGAESMTSRETDADTADEALVADADLHRWILDPEADAWADLLEPSTDPAVPSSRERREGVTAEALQARFDRIHAFLDASSNCPEGVTKAEWKAAKARSLPVLYGDA